MSKKSRYKEFFIFNINKCYIISQMSNLRLVTSLPTANIQLSSQHTNDFYKKVVNIAGKPFPVWTGMRLYIHFMSHGIVSLPAQEWYPSLPRNSIPLCHGIVSFPAKGQYSSLPRDSIPPCQGIVFLPAKGQYSSLPRDSIPPCHGLVSLLLRNSSIYTSMLQPYRMEKAAYRFAWTKLWEGVSKLAHPLFSFLH